MLSDEDKHFIRLCKADNAAVELLRTSQEEKALAVLTKAYEVDDPKKRLAYLKRILENGSWDQMIASAQKTRR